MGARCLCWRRPIPVSGGGSIRKIPELDKAGLGHKLFAEVEANPSVNTVDRIRKRYLETGFDFIKDEDIARMIGARFPSAGEAGSAFLPACAKLSVLPVEIPSESVEYR